MRYRIYKYILDIVSSEDRDLVLIDMEDKHETASEYKILAATSKHKDDLHEADYFKAGEYFVIVSEDILVDESDNLQELISRHFTEFL